MGELVMSLKDEDALGGGQNGPSAEAENGSPAFLAIARHLVGRSVKLTGELEAPAAIQLALRNEEERSRLLDEIVLALAPDGADLGQWAEWLNGGSSPFPKGNKRKGPEKVGKESEWPSQTLIRATPRVNRQRAKVEAIREQLAAEEQKLAYAQAHERAAVQWFVSDHLIDLMSGVFAMGPAWTIMRALSGHMPDEVGEEKTGFLVGGDKDDALIAVRAEWAKESASMLETLDLFSGHVGFEEAVRNAVSKVCKDFDKKRDEAAKAGRRPRSKERMATEVHPKAMDGADAVLAGFEPTV